MTGTLKTLKINTAETAEDDKEKRFTGFHNVISF